MVYRRSPTVPSGSHANSVAEPPKVYRPPVRPGYFAVTVAFTASFAGGLAPCDEAVTSQERAVPACTRFPMVTFSVSVLRVPGATFANVNVPATPPAVT